MQASARSAVGAADRWDAAAGLAGAAVTPAWPARISTGDVAPSTSGSERKHPKHRHLQPEPGIRNEHQIPPSSQPDLVVELHVLGRDLLCQPRTGFGEIGIGIGRAGQHLPHRNAMQGDHQLAEHVRVVRGVARDRGHDLQGAGRIMRRDRVEKLDHPASIDGAEHRPRLLLHHRPRPIGDRLVEEAQRIAHAPIRRPRHQLHRGCLEFDRLLGEDPLEMGGDVAGRQSLEIELQAARQHRDRKLLGVRRREQELHMGRRLFQRLEQCVEALLREHVHLVDEVHLVTAAGRRELDVVHQVACLVYLRTGCSIHLEQVDEPARVDLDARAALAARLRGDAGIAIDAFREDSSKRRLADPTGAGEEEGVVESIRVQRIDERARDVRLPDELLEVAGTPLSGKHLIAHGNVRSVVDGASASRTAGSDPFLPHRIRAYSRWEAAPLRHFADRSLPSVHQDTDHAARAVDGAGDMPAYQPAHDDAAAY